MWRKGNSMICQFLIIAVFVILTNAQKAGKNEITQKKGTFQSQNRMDGIDTYSDNLRQILRFNAKGVNSYTFTFTNIDIEAEYDWIRIYNADHEEVARITGIMSKKVVEVNSKRATIEFTSDDSTGGGGWDLSYKAGAGGSVDAREMAELQSELNSLTKQLSTLSVSKSKQVFFDLGLVMDTPPSKNMITLQLNRHYHTTSLFLEIDQEFACKQPGFYKFSMWGQTGRTGNTAIQIQHFSMHRSSSINNGLWRIKASGYQPKPFGNIEASCIIWIRMNDRMRLRYNGTFTDDPLNRKFHFVGGLFA